MPKPKGSGYCPSPNCHRTDEGNGTLPTGDLKSPEVCKGGTHLPGHKEAFPTPGKTRENSNVIQYPSLLMTKAQMCSQSQLGALVSC